MNRRKFLQLAGATLAAALPARPTTTSTVADAAPRLPMSPELLPDYSEKVLFGWSPMYVVSVTDEDHDFQVGDQITFGPA